MAQADMSPFLDHPHCAVCRYLVWKMQIFGLATENYQRELQYPSLCLRLKLTGQNFKIVHTKLLVYIWFGNADIWFGK
jgi:hypothetical protein